MRSRIVAFLVCIFLVSAARAGELSIEPVYQRTPMWCWAAVGEMIFRHYGVANINPGGDFQCGILALLHPVCNQNCYNCPVPAGSLSTMNNMLTQYPSFAGRVTRTSTRVSTSPRSSRLTLAEVRAEIDAGRPIVAGISPSGYNVSNVSQHVALIVGYDGNDLIVNDPFPFGTRYFNGDPYEAAGGAAVARGQYRIPYRQFVERLQWRESIYRIRCSGPDCAGSDASDDRPAPPEPYRQRSEIQYGRSCRTPVTRCGPFYNQPAQPLGSACWCATPYGPSQGEVIP